MILKRFRGCRLTRRPGRGREKSAKAERNPTSLRSARTSLGSVSVTIVSRNRTKLNENARSQGVEGGSPWWKAKGGNRGGASRVMGVSEGRKKAEESSFRWTIEAA